MEKPIFIIGIVPDVEKSGVAVLYTETRQFTIIQAASLYEVLVLFAETKKTIMEGGTAVIVIEDSDNTSNWHLSSKVSPRAAAAIGHGAGMCHATQRHFEEFAKVCSLEVVKQKPLKKTWMGRDGKITQEEIMQFIPGLPKKMNQECRDAALLAWNEAGLPISIPAGFYQKKFSMENLKHDALKEFKEKTKKEGEFLYRAGLRKPK